MAIESSGHGRGNPRIFELIEHTPREEGASPTIWAWPQFVEFTKVAGQPVRGPWPPHQEPRPDPDRPGVTDGPVAIPDPAGQPPSQQQGDR
ncbi:MAG TPA: hypothetical protein VNQ73_00855 [Ilumatobacter sp.]|nr:hypothetical protein [Ilumatobacter sp.]